MNAQNAIKDITDSKEIDKQLQEITASFHGMEKIIAAFIVVICVIILIKLVDIFINKQLESTKQKKKYSYRRILTVMALVKKILKGIILFIGITILISLSGLSIAPIIATLGIFSLAIGVGAQNLVRDIINGFFIIFEDQFSVGDDISIGNLEGIVENLGLRCTRLRDFDGTLHIIPNSKVEIVNNRNRGHMRIRVDIGIDNRESPKKIINILENALKNYKDREKNIDEDPEVWGVTENKELYFVITVAGFTRETMQYADERKLREFIIEVLQENNIKLPRVKNAIWEDD